MGRKSKILDDVESTVAWTTRIFQFTANSPDVMRLTAGHQVLLENVSLAALQA